MPGFDVLVEGEPEEALGGLLAALLRGGSLSPDTLGPGISLRTRSGGVHHNDGRAATVDPETVPSGFAGWLSLEGASVPYAITRGGFGAQRREKERERVTQDLDLLAGAAAEVVLTDWDLSSFASDLDFARGLVRRFNEDDAARLSLVVSPEHLDMASVRILALGERRDGELRIPVTSLEALEPPALSGVRRDRIVLEPEIPIVSPADDLEALQTLLDEGFFRIDGRLRHTPSREVGELAGVLEVLNAGLALRDERLARWGAHVAGVGLDAIHAQVRLGVSPDQLGRVLLLDALGLKDVDSELGRPAEGGGGWDLFSWLGDGVSALSDGCDSFRDGSLPELRRFDDFFAEEGLVVRERISENERVRFLFEHRGCDVGLWVIPAGSSESCYKQVGDVKVGYSGPLEDPALMERFTSFVSGLGLEDEGP